MFIRGGGGGVHVKLGEVLVVKIGDPVTQLGVPSHDKADFLQSSVWEIYNFYLHS